MKSKADDYFEIGPISIARFGKFVEMKNNITPEAHNEVMQKLAEDYQAKKQEIDDCIVELRELIIKCNPVLLLQFAQANMLMSFLGKTSEFQYDFDDINLARLTEYAQSVIVSSPNEYVESNDDPTELFLKIQNKFSNLSVLINQFYLYWGAYTLINDTSLSSANVDMLIQAQMLYNVRGDRYQIHEIEYLQSLILPHDAEIKKYFNISAQNIIDGIGKLQYALSQGKADAFNCFNDMIEMMKDMPDEEREEYMSANIDYGQNLVQDMLGFSLNNVASITLWPNEFIDELAYGINEVDEFFSDGEFSGWPIVDLPIHKKPFLKIDDRYYCFDYYSLIDNFYRVLQKTLTKHDKSYNWAEVQNRASEEMVGNIFKSILPGCTVYRNNYYPIKSSLKNMAENDILILYCGLLFIIEIKAGSFVYTPPITDFDAHIKSYKKLIEEPEEQCLRTLNYITTNSEAKIYDLQKSVKATISVPNSNNIFTFSITVDNINSFAARAEKLKFLNLNTPTICLSVDDLMVYRDYFESPLQFIHFLYQRRAATLVDTLVLNDELDHLGMYIFNNCYALFASTLGLDENTKMNYVGYREELDTYFTQLYHHQLHPQKPQQKLPELFKLIIKYLEQNNRDDKIAIANYLLNFELDARNSFCEQIHATFKKQIETQRQQAICAFGNGEYSLRYTCFVSQPHIEEISNSAKIEYVLGDLARYNEDDRALITLYFNELGEFESLDFKLYTKTDIGNDYDKYYEIGDGHALSRVRNYLLAHKKIGRNDMCPCGSGLKYKKCHGKV